ncbi:MAG TPA: hypothetical protein VF392_10370 [Terracidiphilus sp.]
MSARIPPFTIAAVPNAQGLVRDGMELEKRICCCEDAVLANFFTMFSAYLSRQKNMKRWRNRE